LKFEFDSKAGIITKLYGSRGDAIGNFASAKITPRNGDRVITLRTENEKDRIRKWEAE
jgi:hypothetical protein